MGIPIVDVIVAAVSGEGIEVKAGILAKLSIQWKFDPVHMFLWC